MLSRVSHALAQLIKPVSPAPESSKDIGRENPRQGQSGFQRFQKPVPQAEPEKSPQEKSDGAKILPFPEKTKPSPQPQLPAKAGASSVSHSFLELLQLLHSRRGKVLNWIGARAYRSAGTQSRKGRFAKGSMVDHKAE